MKVLLALAALVVAVCAKPQPLSLEQRIDASFMKWMSTERREIIYPDGFKDRICPRGDCCESNSCAHGTCVDERQGKDDVVSKYGYICKGDECGTGDGQYAGTFCDVDAKTACKQCKTKHGADHVKICYSTSTFRFGYICMDKLENGDYLALDRREMDVMYGDGTAAQLERIAKEEAEAEVSDKKSLALLLRELIADLE